MNYFAHGRAYCQRPYFLAGTAVPDLLNVVDRRVRARSAAARQRLDDDDPRVRELAAGIVRHHHDDRWFHQTRAFAELNLQLTGAVRERLPGDEGFRTGFLGHILVELLLDAELIRRDPRRLERYYEAFGSVDAALVAETVSEISGRDASRLEPLWERFCDERFLADYGEDSRLLMRLNHVMLRVRLPLLPGTFQPLLPAARQAVRARADELLEEPPAAAGPGGC